MCFFPNPLNKKRMKGRSKIFGKKDRSPFACLRVNNYSFLLASKETYYSLDVREL